MAEVSAISSSDTNPTAGSSAVAASAASSGSMSMNFDDFIDMINPLQHIPIVSSIYRAVTGETINPISRIAGDTMYGGILGLASAGIAAIGAIGDEVVAANNDGKGISDTVVAALFGDDADKAGDTSDTQLAAATPATSAPATQLAVLQTPATQSPILEIPDLSTTPIPAVQMASASTAATASNAPDNNAISLAMDSKGMPLDRSKLAYGGVMDSAMMQSAQQNQALALAMASGTQNMQAQQAMRSNRFAVGGMPVMPTQTPASATAIIPMPTTQNPMQTAAAIATQAVPSPGAPNRPAELTQPVLQNLVQQLQSMKGLNQYRNAAQSLPLPGTMLNTAN